MFNNAEGMGSLSLLQSGSSRINSNWRCRPAHLAANGEPLGRAALLVLSDFRRNRSPNRRRGQLDPVDRADLVNQTIDRANPLAQTIDWSHPVDQTVHRPSPVDR